MRTRLMGTIAIITLALTACGGDDDGGGGDDDGGSGGGDPQDQVADMMIEVLGDVTELQGVEGVEIDEECIRDKVDELSDADAQAILDAGPEGDADISDEAETIGDTMIECVDMSGIDLGELDTDG